MVSYASLSYPQTGGSDAAFGREGALFKTPPFRQTGQTVWPSALVGNRRVLAPEFLTRPLHSSICGCGLFLIGPPVRLYGPSLGSEQLSFQVGLLGEFLAAFARPFFPLDTRFSQVGYHRIVLAHAPVDVRDCLRARPNDFLSPKRRMAVEGAESHPSRRPAKLP